MRASGKKCIMLMDSNRFMLSWLGDYLESVNFKVIRVETPEDGLKQLSTHRVHLIIMELTLPGMGGMGFLRNITLRPGELRFPVLVLTARPGMQEFCEELGVAGFVNKTAHGRELGNKIIDILKKQENRFEPAPPTRKGKLLLGEDEELLVGVLRKVFQNGGYEVDVALDGPTVINKAIAGKPDVIVIKEILPGMNGSAVAADLRANAATQAIPVILYDETRAADDRQRYGSKLPDGVTTFLTTSEGMLLLRAAEEALKQSG